jgi:hypothetical protein
MPNPSDGVLPDAVVDAAPPIEHDLAHLPPLADQRVLISFDTSTTTIVVVAFMSPVICR